MKKILLLFGIIFFTLGQVTYAQIADGTVLTENIIIEDLDGNTYDFFEILDEGKTIVLDLFATWCGPCWNYQNTGALKNLHNTYGPDGSGDVFVMAIESDPETPITAIWNGAGGSGVDWTANVPYPMANNDLVSDIFEQSYYPYIIRICPNRQVFEVGQLMASGIMNHVNTCLSASDNDFDLAILEYKSNNIYCDETEMIVEVQNLGVEPITEATFKISADGEIVSTYDWTGNLEQYDVELVSLGSIALEGNPTVEVAIDTDLEMTQNTITQDLISKTSTSLVTLRLKLDNYPSETSWEIRGPDDAILYSGGPYPSSMAKQLVEEEFQLGENLGCYEFIIHDQYGDGLNAGAYGGTNGWYQFKSSTGVMLASGGGNNQFKKEAAPFKTTEYMAGVGLEDIATASNFMLFPNPATDNLQVSLELAISEKVSLNIYDIVGKVVHQQDLGTLSAGQIIKHLDVAHLNDGVYFLNIQIGENILTSKFVVRK